MNTYCLGALLIVSCVNASADNLVMDDYAKGVELTTENQSSIYKVSLPEQVYRYVVNTDMSDIRVFNQSNEAVPHIVKQQKNSAERFITLELPYFPLPFDDVELLGNQLDVTVSSEGKVIQIQAGNDKIELAEVAKYYLIGSSPDRVGSIHRVTPSG